MLKKANRNLKVLLSIGGWSYSPNFALPVSTAKGRAEFARSAVQLVQDNGLDGLDIDWEFPKNAGQAQNFVDLLGAVRDALSNYTAVHGGNRLLLTTASPAGPWAYKMLLLKQMDQYLDFWNMMAYDYSGSWDPKAAHQANLFLKLNDTDATPFNTQQAVDYYINQGIALDKIVIGMPLYGRSFEKTTGPGGNYSGVGSPDQEAGAWEAGVWDYKSLPRTGAQENIDDSAGASYSYDSISREMISYDNVEMSRRKAEYIVARGLGGGMWWESSGDKPFGKGSLIEAVSTILKAKGGLEASSNTIGYPGSKFDNVKRGFSV